VNTGIETGAQEPDGRSLDDLVRDAYAHFGLAYYLAECVFHGLVQVLATSGVAITRGAFEERLRALSRQTLGPLVEVAKGELPADVHAELDRVVERRNFLAHGFWYERIDAMLTVDGIKTLIDELVEDQKLFARFSNLTDQVVDERLRKVGLPDARLQAVLEDARLGKALDPLPDRPLPRRGASMRINRAWFVPAGNLVFEDDAGNMWQPCDLGLGWHVGEREPQTWQPASFSRLLPATVVARPKDAQPWTYTLAFSTGFELQVFLESPEVPRMRLVRSGRRDVAGRALRR
jgi:hypothetical protein